MKPDMSTYERDKALLQGISHQDITTSTGVLSNISYPHDSWASPVTRTRFTVSKVENGYILESGGMAYIAETVEQVQGIVATLLIAKAG